MCENEVGQQEQLAYIEGELRAFDGMFRDFRNRHQVVLDKNNGITADLSGLYEGIDDARMGIAMARDHIANMMNLTDGD